jgi:2-hydroxy-6-oxonona-2,4-dienedioate hydrolase/4,5:9,10-diseco-3-hydroxy-5,9,17-trioxoandrosta-1(10),2-diene-4-oate hydrolase
MAIDKDKSGKYVKVQDLDIHYHEAGEGPVLLFIHGSGPGASGWSNFSRNIDYFAQSHRVIVVDLPNFGKSTKLSVPIDRVWSYYADVMVGVMSALGIDKADLVGNSLGGGISLKMAMDYPDRVGRLVLMGAAGGMPLFTPLPAEGMKHLFDYYEAPGPSREKLRNFLQVMVFDASQLTDELFEERFEASNDPAIIANPLFSRSRVPSVDALTSKLTTVAHKTLLVWGRDDRTVTFDSAFFLLKLLPDARLHVFSKCGHWAQWEKAPEFNALVSAFLQEEVA